MEVNATTAPLQYHQLWLRGDDQLFATLAAEENRFKEIKVSGLLREYLPTSEMLDLASVQIMDKR
jgi:hypothetical protein